MQDLDYQVSFSKRARQMRIEVSIGQTVTVIVPIGFNPKLIDPFVQSKRKWIETSKLKFSPVASEAKQTWSELPTAIDFKAVNHTIRVFSHESNSQRISIRQSNTDEIHISHGRENLPQTYALLREWVRRSAANYLPEVVNALASKHDLRPKKVTIRIQKTKWGSYSTSGTMSLNAKLMFIPSNFVELIILHELAHMKHMNHSNDFWRLLSSMEPDAKVLDKELRKQSAFVPLWMHA